MTQYVEITDERIRDSLRTALRLSTLDSPTFREDLARAYERYLDHPPTPPDPTHTTYRWHRRIPKPGWRERARDCAPAWQRMESEPLRGEWEPIEYATPPVTVTISLPHDVDPEEVARIARFIMASERWNDRNQFDGRRNPGGGEDAE